MRRGFVEMSHDALKDTMQFRLIKNDRDELGNKKELDLAFEVPVDDFLNEFLIGELEMETESEDKRVIIDEYIKATGHLPNPYNPDLGEDLEAYLSTKESREIKSNHPAFHVEIACKWNAEKEQVEFHLEGMNNDIVRTLHACMQSNMKFEHLAMLTLEERINASKQVVDMQKQN